MPKCACGHTEADHFRGTGNCMVSTGSETWACGCAGLHDRPCTCHGPGDDWYQIMRLIDGPEGEQ